MYNWGVDLCKLKGDKSWNHHFVGKIVSFKHSCETKLNMWFVKYIYENGWHKTWSGFKIFVPKSRLASLKLVQTHTLVCCIYLYFRYCVPNLSEYYNFGPIAFAPILKNTVFHLSPEIITASMPFYIMERLRCTLYPEY